MCGGRGQEGWGSSLPPYGARAVEGSSPQKHKVLSCVPIPEKLFLKNGSFFCDYNKMPEAGYFIKRKVYLVLEAQRHGVPSIVQCEDFIVS